MGLWRNTDNLTLEEKEEIERLYQNVKKKYDAMRLSTAQEAINALLFEKKNIYFEKDIDKPWMKKTMEYNYHKDFNYVFSIDDIERGNWYIEG